MSRILAMPELDSPIDDSPYIDDVGVLGLMANRWGDTWLGQMQFFTRLAKYFHVVWTNPAYGWRSYEWRRLLWRQSHWGCSHYTIPSQPGFHIYEPSKLLPDVGRPRVVGQILTKHRLQPVRRILDDLGCKKVIVYLWRPQFADSLDLLGHDISCYHINDEYTFSPVEKPLGEEEAKLISRVDQVLIHSPALMEKKGGLNPNTLCVPNGVAYRSFSTPVDEPADMRGIPHPRIGYVGHIKIQLDIGLLVTLARCHPKWSFVLVGPKKPLKECENLFQELLSMPNVYYLGGKPVEALPGYVQYMDVCMLCYALNDYTKFIYPLKLHEYLAAGCPVVGAPIRSLLEFEGVIKLARTPEEWSQALTESLAKEANDPAQVEVRRAVARQYDWDHLVKLIVQALCERLGLAYLDRFHSKVSM